MTLTYSPLIYFLNKPTSAKGLMLHLRMDAIKSLDDGNCPQEIQDMLQMAAKEKKCQVFEDSSGLFIYFAESHQDDIAAILIKIQFILGISFSDNLTEDSPFYHLYDLKTDLQQLKDLLQETKTSPRLTTAIVDKKQPLQPVLQEATFSMPFTPALLAQMEKSLQQADLSNLMRRQAVCALVGHAQPIELFEEIYVALADLKKALCPTVDIYQSPWLLDRLLETLDKRVLENMTHHDAGAFRKNFSLNIAVKTILSPEFQNFNESIEVHHRQSILLEIKLHDIFGNLPAFLAAKSFISEQGYRLCIDMTTGDSLSLIDREKLGADFIKLLWNEDLLQIAQSQKFIDDLQKNNPKNIVLCHVDDKRAIELGQTLGISLFQGYYIQKLLYQKPKK